METIKELAIPSTVGEWVSRNWKTAEVFSRYGIDFCCGGKQTLQQACEERELTLTTLERELQALLHEPPGRAYHFNAWSLTFLIDYIVEHHHTYVTEALPFLLALSNKVTAVHGPGHPELIQIQQHVEALAEELTVHMRKEELILFPYVRQLEQAEEIGQSPATPPFVTVQNPIAVMEDDHTRAGHALHEIEALSNHFTPPPDACVSYQTYFAKLREFQDDLHQHVHLENNILFTKAAALEQRMR